MDATEQTGERLRQAEQVSARAVVVPLGEDPTPHLLEAGIIEPIRLPFAEAAGGGSAGSMGDGATPGLRATLVVDAGAEASGADNEADEQPDHQARAEGDVAGDAPESRSANLPEAFGMQTMAPVWRRR